VGVKKSVDKVAFQLFPLRNKFENINENNGLSATKLYEAPAQ